MHIIDLLAKNSRFYPDETAFIEVKPVTSVKMVFSWAKFGERVNRLADALSDGKVKTVIRFYLLDLFEKCFAFQTNMRF